VAPALDHEPVSTSGGAPSTGRPPSAELPSEQLWRAALHAALGAAHGAAELRRELAARAMPPAA
jgi:hypothetical protein